MIDVSWTTAERIAIALARKLKPLEPLELYMVPRGGLMVGYWIATMLDIPKNRLYTTNLDWPALWGHSTGRILIVDDISDTGATHKLIKNQIRNDYTFATLIQKTQDNECPSHVYGITINSPEWVHFPWETQDDSQSDPDGR